MTLIKSLWWDTKIKQNRSKIHNLHISYTEPTAYEAQQGDLWWSINNGRLFVYYEYAALNPDTNVVETRNQWVVAQPLGTKTLVGASDTPVVSSSGTPTDTLSHQMTDNTISIGGVGPSSRPNASPSAPRHGERRLLFVVAQGVGWASGMIFELSQWLL